MASGLLLYLLTGAHSIVTGDNPEFVGAAASLGVPHAPGYPLLTLIGHVFTWLPLGSTVFRLTILAALLSTATIGLVYATALRVTSSDLASFGAAVALAGTPVFWRWSIQFEVFSLNNFLAALVLYLLVRWKDEPRRDSMLIGAAFAFGLGLANQQTIALLVPAVLWVLWLNRRQLKRRPSTVALAAGALIVGVLPYLYVPLAASRHPLINFDDVHSASDFWRLIGRGDYGGLQLAGSSNTGSPFGRMWYLALASGLVGVLAVLGVARARRRSPWFLWFVAAGFGVAGVLFMFPANINPSPLHLRYVIERFFLLPIVIIAPLAAFGVVQLAGWGAARIGERRAALAATGLVAVLAVAGVAANYQDNDLRSDTVTAHYAEDILASLKPNAVLFVTGDESDIPLLWAQAAENLRPDVTVLVSPLLPADWYLRNIEARGELAVPSTVTVLILIQANPSRPFAAIGDLPDKSIDGQYYLYRDGLVNDLIPQAQDIAVSQLASDNQNQLEKYRIPKHRDIKARSFEKTILDAYASIPYAVGQQYDQGGQASAAITWYEKALDIDPDLPKVREALDKLQK
jgi:hypothetical protein